MNIKEGLKHKVRKLRVFDALQLDFHRHYSVLFTLKIKNRKRLFKQNKKFNRKRLLSGKSEFIEYFVPMLF